MGMGHPQKEIPTWIVATPHDPKPGPGVGFYEACRVLASALRET